jgi:hypothetical protein
MVEQEVEAVRAAAVRIVEGVDWGGDALSSNDASRSLRGTPLQPIGTRMGWGLWDPW